MLKFKQSPGLKSYIGFNSIFKMNLFKLINNSVFRKTMKNLRNRVDLGLVIDVKNIKS